MHMTLQNLQYFLAIARTGSFTKAADECFVTQPTLSRAIQELEEELDCELLKRTRRSVELTDAGNICVAEAQRVLNDIQRMYEKVQAAARIQELPIRIGYIIYDHLMCFVQLMANPDDGRLPVSVETKYATCKEIKKCFCRNELDALILPEPCALDIEDAEKCMIARGKAYAIVSKDNPLFAKQRIQLAELREHPIIAWNEKDVPLLHAAFVNMFTQAGYRPRVIGTAEKMGDMLTKIIINKAIGFGTSVATTRSTESVRYIEIEDSPENFGIACIWHRGQNSEQMERFQALIRSVEG